MRDNDSFGDAIDCATLAAAQAAGGAAYRGARCAAAGTLAVLVGENLRTLRFAAGETIRCGFASVNAGASTGCVPVTLFL